MAVSRWGRVLNRFYHGHCRDCDQHGNGLCARCYGTGTNCNLGASSAACEVCKGSGKCQSCKGRGWQPIWLPSWLDRLLSDDK